MSLGINSNYLAQREDGFKTLRPGGEMLLGPYGLLKTRISADN